MKIFAWVLCIFSIVGVIGLLNESSPSMPGIGYGLAVAIFSGIYLNERAKQEKADKLKA